MQSSLAIYQRFVYLHRCLGRHRLDVSSSPIGCFFTASKAGRTADRLLVQADAQGTAETSLVNSRNGVEDDGTSEAGGGG